MPGKTLGVRRIQSRRTDLVPLKRAHFNIPSMLHAKTKNFVDAKGKPFILEKTLSSRLSCYKINSVEKKNTASLLWLDGINFPVTVPRPPQPDLQYARMLHIKEQPWIIYDYVRDRVKDTYRRV
jgi:hypothetical protein